MSIFIKIQWILFILLGPGIAILTILSELVTCLKSTLQSNICKLVRLMFLYVYTSRFNGQYIFFFWTLSGKFYTDINRSLLFYSYLIIKRKSVANKCQIKFLKFTTQWELTRNPTPGMTLDMHARKHCCSQQ